jgi:hypothetical protein
MSGWRDRAKCKDLTPEEADKLFFPSTGGRHSRRKVFCNGCPVKLQCRNAGIAGNEEFGLWGGETAESLRSLPEEYRRKVSEAHLQEEQYLPYLASLPPRSQLSRAQGVGWQDESVDPLDEIQNPLDFLPSVYPVALHEQNSQDAIDLQDAC